MQLLATIHPPLVAKFVVDWQCTVGVHVPRKHRRGKILRHG
jgi:hypothetical protein